MNLSYRLANLPPPRVAPRKGRVLLHIFLQGQRNVGKSTAIHRMLAIIQADRPLKIGGFRTWRGNPLDPWIYIGPADPHHAGEKYRLATFGAQGHGISCDARVFDLVGTRLLSEAPDSDIIIMDELGFLEHRSFTFQKAVFSILAQTDVPVVGVLRLGDIPWHASIKASPRVSLWTIDRVNRDNLPHALAVKLTPLIKAKNGLT